jgi:PAS domain S-box-containing protein
MLVQAPPYPAVLRNDLGFAILVAVGLGVPYVAVQLGGGSPIPLDHLVYLPILAAAHRWGWRGGLTTALIGAFVMGPLSSLLGLTGAEDPAGWTVLAVELLGIGVLTGWLFDQERRSIAAREATATDLALRDAASQKLAERAERTADRLRFQASLLEEVQSAVIATDLENGVTYWNRAAESIYGWSSGEAVGQNLHALLSDDPDHAAAVPRAVVRDGKRWMGNMRDRRKDGSQVLTSVSAVPLRDAEGRIVGGIGTAVDITEQDASATEVRAAGLRLAAVLNAAPQAVVLIDGTGIITEWNRAAERMFGWMREEAIGHTAAELVAPLEMLNHGRVGLAALPEVAAGDLPPAVPLMLHDRNGAAFAVALGMAPVGTPDRPSYAIFVTPSGTPDG